MAIGCDSCDELERLECGGEHAVAEQFSLHRTKLLRMIALRLDARLLSKVDADDILQETYVAASRRIEDYYARPTVPFFVWLRQLALQVLVDTHRRYLGAAKRDIRQETTLHRAEGAGTHSGPLICQLADSLTSPSQCAVRVELLAQMKSALDQLGAMDREVLILRHLEGLSNNEVAQILEVDKFAASKRYLRALARLKGAMTEGE